MSCGTYTFSRTWARTDNSCSNLTGFTQKQLDMRRKAEILEYKQNSMKLTKKQQYAQIAKGGGPQRKKSWATQSHDPTYTNSNTRNLEEKGNTLGSMYQLLNTTEPQNREVTFQYKNK